MSSSSAPPARIAELKDLLQRARSVAIVTHYNPDGDAMGSSLGLAHLLRALGFQVEVLLPNTPAGFLDWLPGRDTCTAFDKDPERVKDLLARSEVLFCLDFNRVDRVGPMEEVVAAVPVKVLIDHHEHPDDFVSIAFSDAASPATCQMVYDIALAMGWKEAIGTDAATCLYTGLVTDTGSFRFSSTTPHTMRVAAALMERGVRPERVHEAVMDDNTEDRLKLLGFTLNERMTVLPEQATVVMGLSMDDLHRFRSKQGDTEGFVNYGLSIRGIRLAAFFMERSDTIKISLRSKGSLPVNELLAQHFKGGGHRNAAGGRFDGTLGEAIARFKEVLPAFLAQHPA
jgi:phosphoesterase RecJ-like protein